MATAQEYHVSERNYHIAYLIGMPMTAPARGEAMIQMTSVRLDGVWAAVKADGALYAVLTPAQRKTADEMMTGPMERMWRDKGTVIQIQDILYSARQTSGTSSKQRAL